MRPVVDELGGALVPDLLGISWAQQCLSAWPGNRRKISQRGWNVKTNVKRINFVIELKAVCLAKIAFLHSQAAGVVLFVLATMEEKVVQKYHYSLSPCLPFCLSVCLSVCLSFSPLTLYFFLKASVFLCFHFHKRSLIALDCILHYHHIGHIVHTEPMNAVAIDFMDNVTRMEKASLVCHASIQNTWHNNIPCSVSLDCCTLERENGKLVKLRMEILFSRVALLLSPYHWVVPLVNSNQFCVALLPHFHGNGYQWILPVSNLVMRQDQGLRNGEQKCVCVCVRERERERNEERMSRWRERVEIMLSHNKKDTHIEMWCCQELVEFMAFRKGAMLHVVRNLQKASNNRSKLHSTPAFS